MIGMIAAVTMNGVIGIDGKIPFDYPEDMSHFRKTTIESVVVMGRKTFEGIGKPLPHRENIVITSQKLDIPNIKTYSSLKEAIRTERLASENNTDIWLIGGAKIYEEGMFHVDKILLTITPDYEWSENAIRFPWINPKIFEIANINILNIQKPKYNNDKLHIYEYSRKKAAK